MLGNVASVLVCVADNRDDIAAASDLVVLEPVVVSGGDARTILLDIFDGVDVGCDGIVDVDYHDLPVGFAAVIGSDATENFGLSNLAEVTGVLTDVEEVDGVVVALFVNEVVKDVRVFPGLGDLVAGISVECDISLGNCSCGLTGAA